MRDKLPSFSASRFVSRAATMTGGNAVAMALPILIAPILGRLYVPADYGALAQYMAPAAIIIVLATLQMQHAIIADEDEADVGTAFWFCVYAALVCAGLTAGAIGLLWQPLLAGTAAGAWFFALPLTVAMTGLVTGGTFLANRHLRFKWLASLQIGMTVTQISTSVLFGVLGSGAAGLILAYLAGQVIQFSTHIVLLLSTPGGPPTLPDRAQLRRMFRRHWHYPAFTLPSEVLDRINNQAPILALTAQGAASTLGAFSRARQLVSIPATIASEALAQVFRQEGATQYREAGNCRRLMVQTAAGLFALGLLPCVAFVFLAPWMFRIYLGPAWVEAGELARILAPMLLLRMTVYPLMQAFQFTGNQALYFRLTLLSTAIMIALLGAALTIYGSAYEIVIAFSIAVSISYLLYLIGCLKIASAPEPHPYIPKTQAAPVVMTRRTKTER